MLRELKIDLSSFHDFGSQASGGVFDLAPLQSLRPGSTEYVHYAAEPEHELLQGCVRPSSTEHVHRVMSIKDEGLQRVRPDTSECLQKAANQVMLRGTQVNVNACVPCSIP